MISAILLAAGQSKRMNGKNKLYKTFKNEPLINHSINNILSSSIDELIIILGYEKEVLEKIITKNKKIKIIYNKNYKHGMSSSIKIGMQKLSKKSKAFFICLGDMPLVKSDVYNKLILFRNNFDIVIPVYKGKQGNPVLFSENMIKKINTIKGDAGAKKILKINKYKKLNVYLNDRNILRDFNTMNNFNF